MAYKKALDLSADTTIQLGAPGNPTSIEGYYLGAKEIDGDYGVGKLHIFHTAKGNVGVWGKSNSNRILTLDRVGQMCMLSFTGMGKAQKGRKPPYTYELQYDSDNTIDVGGLVANANADAAASSYDDDASDDSEAAVFDEVEAARPVAPARAAAVSSKTSQKTVQDLLARTRKTV